MPTLSRVISLKSANIGPDQLILVLRNFLGPGFIGAEPEPRQTIPQYMA